MIIPVIKCLTRRYTQIVFPSVKSEQLMRSKTVEKQNTKGRYPFEDPVSRSVMILALTAPSNAFFSVSSLVSSDRPLTNRVFKGSMSRHNKVSNDEHRND